MITLFYRATHRQCRWIRLMHIHTITFALTFFILEHIFMLLIDNQATMTSFPKKVFDCNEKFCIVFGLLDFDYVCVISKFVVLGI